MKLLRLKINGNGYKSLQAGFEIKFHSEDMSIEEYIHFSPIVFAGLNGSGKSNVLEALSNIFYNLQLRISPRYYSSKEDNNDEAIAQMSYEPSSYELDLETGLIITEYANQGNSIIKIKCEQGKVTALLYKDKTKLDNDHCSKIAIWEITSYLPDYIISYSSGLNQTLSLPYLKNKYMEFDEYLDWLNNEIQDDFEFDKLKYMDNEYTQAMLVSNLLIPRIGKGSDASIFKTNVWKKNIGIIDIEKIRLIIRTKIKAEKIAVGLYDSRDLIENNKFGVDLFETNSLKLIIEKLKNLATSYFVKDEENEETYYLDYYIDSTMKNAFREMFYTAFELYNCFEQLLLLNCFSASYEVKKDLYNSKSLYSNETLPVLPSDERIFRFKDCNLVFVKEKKVELYPKSLSDGEHQLMHLLLLFETFREKNCLILLDEPDTHFNQQWRSKFISFLNEVYDEVSDGIKDVIISTHTSFIISDTSIDNVRVFKKDSETGAVSVSLPNFQTRGASTGMINAEIFNQTSAIGASSKQELREVVGNGKSLNDKVSELSKYGDSVERDLILMQIMKNVEDDN